MTRTKTEELRREKRALERKRKRLDRAIVIVENALELLKKREAQQAEARLKLAADPYWGPRLLCPAWTKAERDEKRNKQRIAASWRNRRAQRRIQTLAELSCKSNTPNE